MSRTLRFALTATDVAFLAYWTLAALDAAGVIRIPTDWLYANAKDPRVVAWNWSFFPLDVAFSVTGLLAVRRAQRGDPAWRPLALISLILTMVAGGMAVAYWTLLGEYAWGWYLPNLLLLVWPVFFLRKLARDMAQ